MTHDETLSTQDILEITLQNNHIHIKLIQFHPIAKITSHIIDFNESLFHEIEKKIEMNSYTQKSMINDIQKLGEAIYKLFFFDANGKKLSGMDSIFQRENFLILFFNGKIESIPIELAYNGTSYAGLKRCISRSVHGDALSLKKDKLKKNNKSILIIADPTNNSQACYKEGITIFNTITQSSLPGLDRIDFVSKGLSKIELMEFIEEYDLIHFAGHGEYHSQQGGMLLINDKTQFADSDLPLLQKPPNLIFLNACLSGKINPITLKSIIKKLLVVGVTNIVSSSWKMLDDDFIPLISSFYRLYLSGKSIGESFTAIKKENFEANDYKWIYFILYGNPTEKWIN